MKWGRKAAASVTAKAVLGAEYVSGRGVREQGCRKKPARCGTAIPQDISTTMKVQYHDATLHSRKCVVVEGRIPRPSNPLRFDFSINGCTIVENRFGWLHDHKPLLFGARFKMQWSPHFERADTMEEALHRDTGDSLAISPCFMRTQNRWEMEDQPEGELAPCK